MAVSDSNYQSSSSPQSSEAAAPETGERKPFVEPELRCETDLVGGTGDREFFGTTTQS